MKIGYLIQQGPELRRPPFDGPANHVREVIEGLGSLGHQVRLVVRLDGSILKSDDLRSFEPVVAGRMDHGPLRLFERGVRRVQTELRLPYAGLFESCRFALACCQQLRGYDLLYERLTWMGYGSGLAARWLNLPLVVEYNGDPLHDLEAKGIAPQGFQRRLSLALMRSLVRRAAHVVATGDGWREQAIQDWGLDRENVTTVENGTALVKLLRREQLRAFQSADGLQSEIGLVYLGGFYPWHGVQILLRSFQRALGLGAPLRLVLIGSGVGQAGARQLVKDNGLDQRVVFTGALAAPEFAPLLAGADIGLSPYCGWKEFSGLKLFDYKAAGLATIASGEGDQPLTLRHGHTGWIVPPCDEDALTEAILRLAADADLRRQLGQAARIEAESCHGWDRTACQLEHILSRVAADASRV
jgi:glycosyltransferase involved in cell wall biosynthesis